MTDKPPLPQGLSLMRATRSQVQGQPSDTLPNVPSFRMWPEGLKSSPPYRTDPLSQSHQQSRQNSTTLSPGAQSCLSRHVRGGE